MIIWGRIKSRALVSKYIKDVLFLFGLMSNPALVAVIAINAEKKIKERQDFERGRNDSNREIKVYRV